MAPSRTRRGARVVALSRQRGAFVRRAIVGDERLDLLRCLHGGRLIEPHQVVDARQRHQDRQMAAAATSNGATSLRWLLVRIRAVLAVPSTTSVARLAARVLRRGIGRAPAAGAAEEHRPRRPASRSAGDRAVRRRGVAHQAGHRAAASAARPVTLRARRADDRPASGRHRQADDATADAGRCRKHRHRRRARAQRDRRLRLGRRHRPWSRQRRWKDRRRGSSDGRQDLQMRPDINSPLYFFANRK